MKRVAFLFVIFIMTFPLMGKQNTNGVLFKKKHNIDAVEFRPKSIDELVSHFNELKNNYTVSSPIKKSVYLQESPRLDSVVTEYEWKNTYSYDINGNNTEDAEFDWDPIQEKWIGNRKLEYTYTSNNLVESKINFEWDHTFEVWNFGNKHEYTYDEEENLIRDVFYNWVPALGDWEIEYRYTYTYNENGDFLIRSYDDWIPDVRRFICRSSIEKEYNDNGKILSTISKLFNEMTGTLTNFRKEEIIYHSNQNIEYITYSWNIPIENWIKERKVNIILDVNGNILTLLESSWNRFPTDHWKQENKSERTYDENGHLSEIMVYSMDAVSDTWVEVNKSEFYFNAAGKQLLEAYYYWDATLESWIGTAKTDYSRDDLNNLIIQADFAWSSTEHGWELELKSEYSYNTQYSIDEVYLPAGLKMDIENKGSISVPIDFAEYSWDTSCECWNLNYELTLYYSNIEESSIKQKTETGFCLFPNPSTGIINIEWDGINNNSIFQVFNVKGENVFTMNISNKAQLDISKLKNDIYFYKVEVDKKSYRGKIIKK